MNYSGYAWPELGTPEKAINVLNSITIVFTACNFNVNLFPIHSNQIDKSTKATVKIVTTTMFLV